MVFLVLLDPLEVRLGADRRGLRQARAAIADQIAAGREDQRRGPRLLADYQQKLAAAEGEVRGIFEAGPPRRRALGQEISKRPRPRPSEKQRAVQRDRVGHRRGDQGAGRAQRDLAVELAGKIVGAELNPPTMPG